MILNRVAEFAEIFIEEFRKFKIITCAKHFPGLGAATGDPHEVMATSNDKLERFLDYPLASLQGDCEKRYQVDHDNPSQVSSA